MFAMGNDKALKRSFQKCLECAHFCSGLGLPFRLHIRLFLSLLFIFSVSRPTLLEAMPAPQVNPKCSRTGAIEMSAVVIANEVKKGRAVRLDHTNIRGSLDLTGQIVKESLEITNSVFTEPLSLADAYFAQNVDFTGSCFSRDVTLVRAHFSKDAFWRKSTFLGSFYSSAVNIDSCAYFDNASFMLGQFDAMRVGHCASFGNTVFHRDGNFLGMVVAKEISLEGAIFYQEAVFERAEIGGSAFFREENGTAATHFKGTANFKATKIVGQATFVGVIFDGEVRMTRAQFDEAIFRKTTFAKGLPGKGGHNDISFDDAEIGTLDFGGENRTEPATFAPERKLSLAGLVYRRNKTSLPVMLRILEQSTFDRQPYNELEKMYRDAGKGPFANTVYFTRRRREGNEQYSFNNSVGFTEFPFLISGWIWDRIQRHVFGYGTDARYPVGWLSLLFFVSSLLLSRPNALVRQHDKHDGEAHGKYASLSLLRRIVTSIGMSFDLIIPKATLPVARRWRISDNLILIFGSYTRVRYRQLAVALKFIAWTILTVSLGLFNVASLIRG